jgi:hypothetical protein
MKHEIKFWCLTIMNITFVQYFMVVGWISYVIIILRNNIFKIALTKKLVKKIKTSMFMKWLKCGFY